MDNYEIKHGKEKDEKVNTAYNPMQTKYKKVTKNADLPLFKVKTIKKYKANKNDIPTTVTYISSLKEVDLSEESTYQVSKNIIVLI